MPRGSLGRCPSPQPPSLSRRAAAAETVGPTEAEITAAVAAFSQGVYSALHLTDPQAARLVGVSQATGQRRRVILPGATTITGPRNELGTFVLNPSPAMPPLAPQIQAR